MINEQQKRVIRENPHLTQKVLADFLKLKTTQVNNQKKEVAISWSYRGFNFPKMVTLSPGPKNRYKNKRYKVRQFNLSLFQGGFDDAINFQGQFLWMLENGMNPHRAPRVNKPTLTINDKFADGIRRVLND